MTYIKRKTLIPKAQMTAHIKFDEYEIIYPAKTGYQMWLENGNVGTVEDYFYEFGRYPLIPGYNIATPVEQWIAYSSGQDGWTAYNSAVSQGFSGTVVEWLLTFVSDGGLEMSGATSLSSSKYTEWKSRVGSGAYINITYIEDPWDSRYSQFDRNPYMTMGTIDYNDGKIAYFYGRYAQEHLFPDRENEYNVIVNANLKNIRGFINSYSYNKYVTHIEFPKTCECITATAFSGYYSLSSVVIPETVKRIESSAFSLTALTSVTIASDCVYFDSSFPTGCQINFY